MAIQPPVGAREMPLLHTRLYVPPLRREHIPRPIERLNAGLDCRLTLISASVGFGKTTLLSEWIADCGRADRSRADVKPTVRIAQLSLDEGDDVPARFLTYLIAALQQTVEANIGKGMLSALQSPPPPSAKTVLTALINETSALPGRIVLVLDDYHLIEAQPIHDAVTFPPRYLPPASAGPLRGL